MKKYFFGELILIFALILISASQNNAYSQIQTNQKNGAILASYNNIGDANGNTNLIGFGVTTRSKLNPLFYDVEVLFPIGTKHIDIKQMVNVSLGLKITISDEHLIKQLRSYAIGGIGLSFLNIKEPQVKSHLYMGTNVFFGTEFQFYNFLANVKLGPTFTTGTYKFETWRVNFGYIF